MTDPVASGPETVVRDILQGLSEGRFAPGQRLAEPDLMVRYGLSRPTVREALGRLAGAGIVVQAPHRGASIRLLTRRAALDVLRVTEPLLGLAARQAAEAVAAGADPAALVAAALAYGDGGDGQARARFYRALTQLGGNAELDRLLPMLQVHLVRAQLRQARVPGGETRVAMLDAIERGDPEEADLAARQHVRRLIEALPEAPDGVFGSAHGR
jgi:DNA-binding GntR family transcriptional regulator